MAIIGMFTSTAKGFKGSVKTLNLDVKTVDFVPAEGDNEKGPDHRIFAGATDPSFPAQIYASVVETETQGEFSLIWSRRRVKSARQKKAPSGVDGVSPCAVHLEASVMTDPEAILDTLHAEERARFWSPSGCVSQ
ncbi:DUF736 domain-containing protein [Mesorhizobium sp. B2-3-3]|nr:DUF736 domain-containing protein [Mesorhizobium sp. B2-3-3]